MVNISDNAVNLGPFHLLIVKVFCWQQKVVSGNALTVFYVTLVIHTLLLSVVCLYKFIVVLMVHDYGI